MTRPKLRQRGALVGTRTERAAANSGRIRWWTTGKAGGRLYLLIWGEVGGRVCELTGASSSSGDGSAHCLYYVIWCDALHIISDTRS
jgi:hypothetical protein